MMTRQRYRIVHATDLSAESWLAFLHALRLALALEGELTILHVAERGQRGHAPAVREALEQWGMIAPGTSREHVEAETGLRVGKAEIRDHDPVQGVAHFLDRHGCDMLVLATHARDGLGHMLKGSIAEAIANAIAVPTLFVPIGRSGFVEPRSGALLLRRIVMPVAAETSARHALHEIEDLAKALGLAPDVIDLVHVGHEVLRLTDREGTRGRPVRHLPEGPIVAAILDASNEADLIVMPTHGHDSMIDSLRGSTTERVMRQAPCPVLSIPS